MGAEATGRSAESVDPRDGHVSQLVAPALPREDAALSRADNSLRLLGYARAPLDHKRLRFRIHDCGIGASFHLLYRSLACPHCMLEKKKKKHLF